METVNAGMEEEAEARGKKEERGDHSKVMQSLPVPAGSGACDYTCGGTEGGFQYRGLWYVVLGRLPETSLGLTRGRRGTEDVSQRERTQAADEGMDASSRGGMEEGNCRKARQDGGQEEAGFDEQVPKGAGVETMNAVEEEVGLKEGREGQSGVAMQSLSGDAGGGACDYTCDSDDEVSIVYRGLRYVVLKSIPETG